MPAIPISIYILVGALLVSGVFGLGWKAGSAVASLDAAQARAGELDHIVAVDRIVEREVPKIVTQYVQTTTTVTTETEHVLLKVSDTLSPDCIMPTGYGQLLVAAARGIDPADTTGFNGLAGTYDCRAVLNATIKDLAAGRRNTSKLGALQAVVKLDQPKGD
jgi:hypothetical protein